MTNGSVSSDVSINRGFENSKAGSTQPGSVSESNLFNEWEKNLDDNAVRTENVNNLMDGSENSSSKMADIATSSNPFSNEFFESQERHEYIETNSFATLETNTAGKRVLVDTASPFESVKEVVTKYGGIVDWKAHKAQTIERRKRVQQELEIAIQEISKYKERYDSSEEDKIKALEELDHAKKMVEELKHSLEKTITEEAQAKQDSELVELRMKEIEQGIANSASVAAKTQLEVAKERHKTAVKDLISVRQETEDMKRKYASLINEKNKVIKQAKHSISVSKEMDKTVEDLTLELITIKALLESAQSVHLEAEEKRVNSPVVNSIKCERLKKAEAELQQLNAQQLLINDLKSKYDAASTTLASLRDELDSLLKGKLNKTENIKDEHKELHDEGRNKITESKDEVNSLKAVVSALKSALEKEKESVTTLRQREGLASTTVSSLEAELNRMNSELELIAIREKEAKEKMIELPKLLQPAAEEANQAKSVANLAKEELKKAKEEAEQAKSGVSTMETRLLATLKEIEATVESSRLTTSAVKALEESEQSCKEPDSPGGVKLSVEEYYKVNKKAQEAEDLAKKRVISAVEQIKLAKESETVCVKQLEEANRKLEQMKKELKTAVEIAEKAKEGKLEMEQELRSWREEHEQQRKATDSVQDFHDYVNVDTSGSPTPDEWQISKSSDSGNRIGLPRLSTRTGSSASLVEPKLSRRSFFPRVVMFLAKKKVQTFK